MQPTGSGRRLQTQAYDQTGVLEVAAMSELAAADFMGTLYATKEFNSVDDLGKVLIVILLYGSMWALGLVYLLFLAHSSISKGRKVSNTTVLHSVKANAIAKSTSDSEGIRKYLHSYIDLTFPNVFNPSSWWVRLKAEISEHHRYLYIFNPKADPKRRFVTGIHLMTIQSMLMFMLAVFYDWQVETL